MSHYTENSELAEQYIRIVRILSTGMDNYKSIERKIAAAGVNIHRFYEERKSLSDLKVRGIAGKTKRVLELILSEGEEKAAQMYYEEKRRERNEEERRREENNFGFNTIGVRRNIGKIPK